MNRKNSIKILSILIALSILLILKLLFFENNNTQSFTVLLINWIIYLFSVGILISFIFSNHSKIKLLANKYKDKLVVFLAIFVLETVFLMKIQLPFSRVHIFSILIILTIYIFISLFLSRKLSKIFDLFIFIFYSIYIVGQDVYYRIFNDFFSFKEALTIREGIESGQGMYQMNWFHLFVAVVAFAAIYYYIKYTKTSHLRFGKELILKLFMFPLLLLVLIQLNSDYRVNQNRPYTGDYYLYQSVFNRTRFASRFGVSQLIARDFVDSLIPTLSTNSDVRFIDNYLETKIKIHEINEFSGVFKDKNIVFILAESYDEIALSEALTPNIYKLKSEGIDFQNHFTPVFPRTTSDTEHIINTGIIPSIEDGPTTSTYTKNSYRTSLASLFNSNNYITNAFHGNYKEFYTRHIIYNGYGYDSFYGQNELELSDENKMFDSLFYQQASHLVFSGNQPFFSFIISFAGHSPYTRGHYVANEHYNLVDNYYGMQLPDSIKYYIATQIELDIMVGLLFEDLEANHMLDDTVIIFSGDHYPYTLNQDDYTAYTNIDKDYMKHKGNLYIWSSDITATTINKLSTSFDILPTINNMFDLGGNYTNYVGNDIFGNSSSIVLFKNYAVYDGDTYFNLADRHFEDFELIQQATQYYQFSKKILRTNYFKTPSLD